MSREEEDGFLGRWSRLKRAQATPAAAPEPETPAPEAPAPPAEPGLPEPESLSEEELAALPRIEDLAEGSDIRPFLRAGVPRDLRNAALRRMWMLTPAIRDYRDPAVDYAWDWNTPGGVPGDGAAPSPERAAEMLRALVAPREKRPSEPPGEGADAPETPDVLAAVAGKEAPASPAEAAEGMQTARETEVDAPADEPAPLPRRRHGSALPG